MISARIARFLSPMWESRFGISVDTWRILAVVGRYGPLSAKDVAVRTSNDAFHVSRAIDRLVRRRFIRRNVDPNDRRRAQIEINATGRAVQRASERVLARLEGELLAGVRGTEREVLRGALATLDERAVALMASGLTWKDFAQSARPAVNR